MFKTIRASIAAFGLVVGGLMFLEGHSNVAYLDVGGVPTICSGITDGVEMGDTATDQECGEMTKAEVLKFKQALHRHVDIDLPPETEAAFIWFLYNIGETQFVNRSLVYKRLKAHDVPGACDALLRKENGVYKGYIHVNGKVINGLINRRKIEQEFCYAGLER